MVRQRHYAVVKAVGEKSVARTGFLGPCVAFYGLNEAKGVAFMAHVDGYVWGLGKLITELKLATGGDLDGFEVALALNYKYCPRVLVLAAGCIWASWLAVAYVEWYLHILAFLVVAMTVYACFGSALIIHLFSLYWFKRSTIKWRVTDKLYKRAEVEVDSASQTVLSGPQKDRLPPKISKGKYGALAWWTWGKKMESASEKSNASG